MSHARLLLVEDDHSLRRFVRMALEDLPVDLLECDNVPSALAALDKGPVDLIVTDLMMPGESGIDLIDQLQQQPALRGQAKIIVLSAALNPGTRQRLSTRDVWRLLEKPVSVSVLENSVKEALGWTTGLAAKTPAQPATSAEVLPDPAAPLDYFEGNLELYHAYRACCLEQFPDDVAKADAACASNSMQNLRLIAHSLKSVFKTLGYPSLSDQAKHIETLSHAGDSAAAVAAWAPLRDAVQTLIAQG